MSDTPNLVLPYLAAAQAQKHVTHNEALRMLDALVHLAALDRDLAAPPATPADGDRYVVAAGATGAWAGRDGQIAAWQDGAWAFRQPRAGWRCWLVDEGLLTVWTGAAWQPAWQGRTVLSAPRTYYVNGAAGSDGNDGLSAGSAFATIQKAIDTVGGLDLAIHDVTIQLADATYAAGAVISAPWIGLGNVTVQGNAAAPANVHLNTSATAFRLEAGARLTVRDLRISASGRALDVSGFSRLKFGNVDFGACAGQHVYCTDIASVECIANYAISGGATSHWAVSAQAGINVTARTITLSGTPAFSTDFAQAYTLGRIQCNGNTFNGAATGKRYNCWQNSIINTVGGGGAYLPGSTAGGSGSGGLYL